MSETLIFNQIEQQSLDAEYILRVHSPNGSGYFIAIDSLVYDSDMGVYQGWRLTGEVNEDDEPLVKIVITIPDSVLFELIARTEFKVVTPMQIWEEQLEYEAERKKFEAYANKQLGITTPPPQY